MSSMFEIESRNVVDIISCSVCSPGGGILSITYLGD